MTLKRQLFIASLLMLLIPWAGLQFVLELDQALRDQAGKLMQVSNIFYTVLESREFP